ncbi:MAG TPA: DUF2147 domain-containing protein [Alphaproteobacteria bacterium]|nr:DUF2147 domain-containing protein [Alphaproteobacteria bacterium]
MRAAALATALAALALPAAAQAPDVFGLWLTESRNAAVDIQPCGASVCGRIAWMTEPNDAAGRPKLDTENPDPAKRGQPLCGLTMIGGFRPGEGGAWQEGWIYNPEDGKTYTAVIQPKSATELALRGYIGLPLFGQSQTWTRLPPDAPRCG